MTILKQLIWVNLMLLIVTSSYVTLGIFNPITASHLWAFYATITFILAVINVIRQFKYPWTAK